MDLRRDHAFNPDLRLDHASNPFNPSPEHQAILVDVFWDPELDDNRDPAAKIPDPPTMKPAAVKQRAREMATDIFNDYGTLQAILHRHEATIQKRWTKKKMPKKRDILEKAWPHMAPDHRPDFQAFRKEGESVSWSGTKHPESFMWPYINQEDLTKPNTLLHLLNSRGRHMPSVFAAADWDDMHLGRVTTALQPISLDNYVLILNGVTEVGEYGKLVAWDDHPDAFDWVHTGKQFRPGEGLLILEAQQRLLGFLVQFCRRILHAIPDAHMTSGKFPILPEPQLKTEARVDCFESLADMAAEAPYRVPQRLDLGRVRSLLEARASAAEDHLWALREDPSYFADCLLNTKKHRVEMIPDTLKNAHPTTSTARRTLWARIIYQSYIQLEMFSELSAQARDLQSLQAKHEGKLSPKEDLPGDYLRALLKFRYYLQETAKESQHQLMCEFIPSPPMRPFFVCDRSPGSEIDGGSVMSRPGVKLSDVGDQAVGALHTLWEDGEALFQMGLTSIVGVIEHLLKSKPEAKRLVTGHVASVIGDLSIVAQCLRPLELYHPWSNGFDYHSANLLDGIESEFAAQRTKWKALVMGLGEQDLLQAGVVTLGDPSGGRFEYPVGKRRTQQHVETMRQAEANLDAFWACVDQLMQKKGTSIEGTAVKKLLTLGRELQRTPEWVPPPKAEAGTSNQTVSQEDVNQVLTRPFSALYFGSAAASGPRVATRPAKNKVKTRGKANKATQEDGDVDEATEPNEHDAQPKSTVDGRAFKVFRTLFHNPRVTSTPGEVPWADFLHAMASMRFAAEKLYGSVWQFQPTQLDVERSIQFHEPHSCSKIPFMTARQFGRRLSRAYGWDGGMFVLKD